MKQILTIVELITSVAIIAFVLIQAKGTGLGSSFGSGGESFRSKRGVEKIVTIGTWVAATIFAICSVLLLVIK